MSELEPPIKQWPIEEVPNLLKRIYRMVLERECTPEKLIEYGSNLERGEKSVKDIIQEIILEEEYENRFIEPFSEEMRIVHVFKHLLDEDDPTDDQIDHWKEISVVEGVDKVITEIMADDDLYLPGDNDIAFEKDSIKSGTLVTLQAEIYDDIEEKKVWRYVCAGKGSDGLIADRYKPLGWETFEIGIKNILDQEIKSGDNIYLRACNDRFFDRYVKAEGGGGGKLTSYETHQLDHETFTISKVGGNMGDLIEDGDLIRLQAYDAIHYVCTRKEDRLLYANAIDNTAPAVEFIISIQYLR